MNIYICFVDKKNETISTQVANTDQKNVSVIIVNYKSWTHLDRCLQSLQTMKLLSFSLEIIVVDNDGDSVERTEFQKKHQECTIIGNTGNNGFANGCNLGAANAKGDYFLFLNPDTIVNENAFERMFAEIESNLDFGVVSCVQVNKLGDKEKQIRFFPRLKTLFGLFRALYRSRNKNEIYEKFKPSHKIVFPDWVSGSLVFISRSWFDKVAGWNEDYWMYSEDVDLCKRITERGGKIALLKDVNITHNHGGASRKNIKTSSITRTQVLISKHVFIHNNFKGAEKIFSQFLLVVHSLLSKILGAVVGLVLFFIPKMRLKVYLLINLLSYYFDALTNGTWLSERAMNHKVNRSNSKIKSETIIFGYDAKRVYHNRTGLGNYSRDLISILSKFYTEYAYYLYNPKKKSIDRLENRSNINEVLPISDFWKKYSSVWRQGPIVKQLSKDGVQVFHGLSGEIPRGLQAANIKSIVTIHDLIFLRYPKLYKYVDRKIHFKKFKYAAHNSDIIIAISEQTKNDVVKYLDADPSKIRVVYQGCHKYFKETLSEDFIAKVRTKFKVPKCYILNVGTIEERKNLLSLVKSIKDIDIELVVVGGKTAYFNGVNKYVKENNMQERVHFLQNVDLRELVALYQGAKLFVYPSLFEGFGIPIVEALYSKTPVITSSGGCFSEAGGPNSVYVDPHNQLELKAKINEVLADRKLRENMKIKGYEFVQKFNDEVIAEEMMKVYKELI